MNIKFMGAAGRVTGSCYLLEAEGKKIIIDCGLFQGSSASRGKNHEPFAFNPSGIDAVIATHSHIDHIGRIPKLFRDGYRGEVYSTRPTRDFAGIFLEDTLKILREETKRKPDHELIWDKIDLENTLNKWIGYNYHQPFYIENIKVEFFDAGHILGSAIIKITAEGKEIVFSGDLGNPPVPIIEDTEIIHNADYVIVESTYGDRIHEPTEGRVEKLERALEDIYERRGVLMIPAFAMERTQELIYEMNELSLKQKSPFIPIYIDSPLAIKATDVYIKYKDYFDKEAKYLISTGDDIFDFPGLTISKTGEQSRAIERQKNPKAIIAGSGMSTGGRILGHETKYLPDPNNMILFIGFQVKGTLGRKIKDGEKVVKIYGKEVDVRAEIREISGYSAHADQLKLLKWLGNIQGTKQPKPTKIFTTHGEPSSTEAFCKAIMEKLGIDAYAPVENEVIAL